VHILHSRHRKVAMYDVGHIFVLPSISNLNVHVISSCLQDGLLKLYEKSKTADFYGENLLQVLI